MIAYDRRPSTVAVAESAPQRDTNLPLLGLTYGIGGLATAHTESIRQSERFESLLGRFNFTEANMAQVRLIVGEAVRDPRVPHANAELYALAQKGGDSRNFAREVLTHQLDVAELAVMGLIIKGYTDRDVLKAVALAGLVHDLAKGMRELAPTFMDRGIWTYSMRQKGQQHPRLAAERLDALGFGRLEQYLTDRHHQDLRPNPDRNIEGGYIGDTITPSDKEAQAWYEPSHMFSVADDLAANIRERAYKESMSPEAAVDQTDRNLLDNNPTIVECINVFRSALWRRAA